MKRMGLLLLAAVALTVTACSGGDEERAPAVFVEQPLTVAQTDGGLTLSVWASPQPPAVGLAAFRFSFTDTSGAAVDGLDVDVLPWMPAHGHGGSKRPTSVATAPGVFLVDPVSFFMSGAWELRTTIGGARSDAVTVHVEVP
jgi:hypothetical protein